MITVKRTNLGLALLLCAACGQTEFTGSQSQDVATSEAPAAQPRPASKPRAAARPGAEQPLIAKPIVLPDSPPPTRVELPPIAPRGTLLQRLPKSTLLALRLPHVEKLGEAVARTPLATMFSDARIAAASARSKMQLAQVESEMEKKIPDYAELKEKLLGLQGELVVALMSIDAKVFSSKSGDMPDCPVTCALMFDAGAHAEDVEILLQRGFTAIDEGSRGQAKTPMTFDVVTSGADKWHRHARVDGTALDIAREGTQFLLQVGPAGVAPSASAPLPVRELDDSFAAAHVVRATRDLEKEGAQTVVELFVNLDPVWTVVEMFAPPDVKGVLAACGATSIRGFSTVAGLGQTGLDEALFVDSPDGRDLITQVIGSRPIETTLARFIPADAPGAALSTIDVQALVDGVRRLLPDAQKRAMDQELDEVEAMGFDLRKDLIANVGPTFGYSGSFDFLQQLAAGDGTAPADITVFMQLKDAPRFQQLIDRALKEAGAGDHVHTKTVGGVTTWSIDSVPLPGPGGSVAMTIDPSWCVTQGAFVASMTASGLERALAAAADPDNRGPIAFRMALDANAKDAISINMTPGGRPGVPASAMVGRRTSLGMEFVSHEGNGSGSVYGLVAAFAGAGATAVPKLMSERLASNETMAISTLRTIERAERDFRAARFDDLDRDGQGEFGTLGELTGACGLRCLKPALSRPILPATMKPDADDCCIVSGYVFRIDTARRSPRDVDDDEREFVAYAWPVSPGMTGNRVFSVDADGRLMSSDNQGEQQHYAGVDRAPSLDASKRSLAPRTMIGVRGRMGRDGGVWIHVD